MRRIALASLIGVLAAGCGGSTSEPPTTGSASRVIVPKLVGQPWAVARREIAARGLRLRTTALSNLCAGVAGGGSIMLQDPKPGARVDRRSTVKVQTSCHASTSNLAPCQAGRLRLAQSVGAGLGTTYLDLRLRNAASRACELRRSIRARLLGADGTPLLESGQNDSTIHRVVIGPHRRLVVTIGWSNWCRNGGGPFRAELVLPAGGGTLTSHPWGPASCTSRSARSGLFIAGLALAKHGA